MPLYSVDKQFRWDGEITSKAAAVMRMFGVDASRLREGSVRHCCEIELKAGEVCYITGASGAGKSVLLRELYNAAEAAERLDLNEIELAGDKSVIDCMEGDFFSALRFLSRAGLSDVFCVLNQPDRLSAGEKYRFRLAKALASGKKIIFADEFCSNLDRITAAVIACRIGEFAKKHGVTFVLASSHDDILGDLVPDVIVVKYLSGQTEVIYKRLEG